MSDAYMRIAEVAEKSMVHPDTVRRAIARGDLKAYRVGRQIRIRPEDMAAWHKEVPRGVAG